MLNTYKGRVKGGKIVLLEEVNLPDGRIVLVTVLPNEETARGDEYLSWDVAIEKALDQLKTTLKMGEKWKNIKRSGFNSTKTEAILQITIGGGWADSPTAYYIKINSAGKLLKTSTKSTEYYEWENSMS